MKHQSSLELCVAVVLFYANFVTSASVKITNDKINVDEFLKTVMNSKKFDEIADKIANRAVEKFSELNKIGVGSDSYTNIGNETVYRVTEYKSKESTSSESTQDDTEPDVPSNQRFVIGKVDKKALMKKRSSDSSKHLSLNYKHFTKNVLESTARTDVGEILTSKEADGVKSLEEENNKYIAKRQVNKQKKSEATLKNKVKKLRDTMTGKLSLSPERDGSGSSDDKDSLNVMEDKSMPISERKEDITKAGNESKTLRVSDNQESDEGRKGSSGSESNKHEEKSDAEYKMRKPAYEYLKLAEPMVALGSVKKSKNSLETTTLKLRIQKKILNPSRASIIQKEIRSSKSARETLVREEGDELYTYNKSHEYDEYVDQISRIQNETKNINS